MRCCILFPLSLTVPPPSTSTHPLFPPSPHCTDYLSKDIPSYLIAQSRRTELFCELVYVWFEPISKDVAKILNIAAGDYVVAENRFWFLRSTRHRWPYRAWTFWAYRYDRNLHRSRVFFNKVEENVIVERTNKVCGFGRVVREVQRNRRPASMQKPRCFLPSQRKFPLVWNFGYTTLPLPPSF